MNWEAIMDGIKVKIMDLGATAIPLVVLRPPEEMTLEEMEALEQAWKQIREDGVNARLLLMPEESEMTLFDTGAQEWVDHLATKVHDAWMAEKQRQGFADHPTPLYRAAHPVTGQWLDSDLVEADMAESWNLAPRALHYYRQSCCELRHDLHHKDMVPFNALSEATKDYDRATVRAILSALVEEEGPS